MKKLVMLDSNIYHYYIAGYQPAVELIDGLAIDPNVDIVLSIVVRSELRSNPAYVKDEGFKEYAEGLFELSSNLILPQESTHDLATAIRSEWNSQKKINGKKLPLPDALIAVSAIEVGAKLISFNDRDFSLPAQKYELQYENPFDKEDLDRFMNQREGKPEPLTLQNEFMAIAETMELSQALELLRRSFQQLSFENKTSIKNAACNIKEGKNK